MLYEYLVAALESLPELRNNVYPTGVCIDEVEPPICVYTFMNNNKVAELSGEVHHEVDEIMVDILSPYFSTAYSVSRQVESLFQAVSNLDTEHGVYIFSGEASIPQQDGFDVETGLYRRGVLVRLCWCEKETETVEE